MYIIHKLCSYDKSSEILATRLLNDDENNDGKLTFKRTGFPPKSQSLHGSE